MTTVPIVNLGLILVDLWIANLIYKVGKGAFTDPVRPPLNVGPPPLRPVTPCSNPMPDITVPESTFSFPISSQGYNPPGPWVKNGYTFYPQYIPGVSRGDPSNWVLSNWRVQIPGGETCYGVTGPGSITCLSQYCEDPIDPNKQHVFFGDSKQIVGGRR